MRRSRGRQDTSHREQNNPSQSSRSRGGGFEQTGTGYRYDDEQRRFGSRESWREPTEQSRYSEGRDYGSDYDQESQFGRMRTQEWSPDRSRSGWGNVGRADWEQRWNRGREDEGWNRGEYRGSDEYGYDPEGRLGATEGGYEPGDYSYSGRSGSDWSSGMRGSYGQGSQQGSYGQRSQQGSGQWRQQGMYGQSSSNEPWSEGSYQGPSRGITRGSFGQGSYQGRFQGTFAGRGPQGYKRSDERIKEDINEVLTQDPEIDPTNIQVEVQNGEVTLKGTVSDRQDKRRAEDIAESCSGVREVQNQLRVKREDESETETSRRDKSDDRQKHRQMAS